MRRVTVLGRSTLGVTLILGVLAMSLVSPVSAHHSARITIHNARCDDDLKGNIYALCHEQRLAGVAFRVAGVWRATDGAGVVSWTPGAGTRTITQDLSDPDLPADFTGVSYVFCTNRTTGKVLFNGTTTNGRVTITTTVGQPVVCDWYNRTA